MPRKIAAPLVVIIPGRWLAEAAAAVVLRVVVVGVGPGCSILRRSLILRTIIIVCHTHLTIYNMQHQQQQ